MTPKSMCSLCLKNPKSIAHLFLHCPFAIRIWNWLFDIIKLQINLASVLDVLALINRGWSSQCQVVITSYIISIFNTIWHCRNSVRFKSSLPSLSNVLAMISCTASLAGNFTSLTSGAAISDFTILKQFNVSIHHPKAVNVVEVKWSSPLSGWIKVNTYGASLGSTGQGACAGESSETVMVFL
jgi:hypothetical protein